MEADEDPYGYHPDLYLYPWELPASVEEFLIEHGTTQGARWVPLRWRRRRQPAGDCYLASNSWSHKATYTEGRAYFTGDRMWPAGWLPHAWLTTPKGVVDLTWSRPAVSYRGVQIPDDKRGWALEVAGWHGPLLPVLI